MNPAEAGRRSVGGAWERGANEARRRLVGMQQHCGNQVAGRGEGVDSNFMATHHRGGEPTSGRGRKAPPDDGAKDVMHGATPGTLHPSPTHSHSRANTSGLGRRRVAFWL